MEIYKRTGVHPDLAGSQTNSVPPLPERDMNRPHVFMDLQLGKESLGEPLHAIVQQLVLCCWSAEIIRLWRDVIVTCTPYPSQLQGMYGLQLLAPCAGRLVLEVFEDQAPLAARQLLNRCREGTRETLHNTHVHRLITDQGMFFGKSQGYGTYIIPCAWGVVSSTAWQEQPLPLCPSECAVISQECRIEGEEIQQAASQPCWRRVALCGRYRSRCDL